MDRGRMQVLFQYLPGAIFSLQGNQGIALSRFVFVEDEPAIRPDYALSLVKRRIEAWQGHENTPFPPLTDDGFNIGRPSKVLYSYFPLTFYCTKCRVIRVYDNEAEAQQALEKGKCRICGPDGRMRQSNMILVHDCGHLDQVNVPQKCPKCQQDDQLMMDTKGRRRFKDVDWRCMRCDISLQGTLTKLCPICISGRKAGEKQPTMRTAVHTATTNFYVHSVTFVNLRKAVPGQATKGDKLHLGLLAWSLGAIPDTIDLDSLLTSKAADEVILTADQEKQVAALSPDLAEMVRKELLEKAKKQAEQKSPELVEAVGRARDLYARAGPCANAEGANHELVEFVAGRLEHNDERSLADMRQEAEERGWRSVVEATKVAEARMARLGFMDVRLLQKFPLATVAYGFTRTTSDNSARLRPFPKIRGDGRNTMYAVAADTEGILFQLDPRRVVRWLAARGVKGLPDKRNWDDVEFLRTWFLCHIDPPKVFDEASQPEGLLGHEATKMLHSMAHILMRTAALHSGLDASSLKEYTFIRNLSFVVYHNSQVEQNLGALYTLVQQAMDPWLESAEEARDCIFDPVCSAQHGAACHACMHSGETSCERFNRLLSRDAIWDFDGKPGFWGRAWNTPK